MKHVKNLVVGCGLSGAVIAERIASELNENVLVIDAKDHIGGNIYDYKDPNGITVHKYGSHIFHTNLENVWRYLSRFTDFNTYMHRVIAVIDGIETHIPFNIKTLYDVFPQSMAQRLEEKLLKKFEYNKKVPILEFQKQDDDDLKFLANYVYEKVFLHYTTKQWGMKPSDVDGAVTARVPVFIGCDDRYFQDKYQGIPRGGYTAMVQKIISNPKIKLQLSTSFDDIKNEISYDRLFFTGPIDAFFDYKFGELPYRSVSFKFEEYDREYYQAGAVVNYPCNYDFTRIHEYKYYLNEKSAKTVIAKEYSEDFERGKNERYYPVPKNENQQLYNRYLQEAEKLKNVYFLGRLGDYKYYDMDKAAARALELFETIRNY